MQVEHARRAVLAIAGSPNNAPRNAYLTRDGRWVAISAGATSIAERVMRLVGRADLTEIPFPERGPWEGPAGRC